MTHHSHPHIQVWLTPVLSNSAQAYVLVLCLIFKQEQFFSVLEPSDLLFCNSQGFRKLAFLITNFSAQLSQEMNIFLTNSCIILLLPTNHILSYYPAFLIIFNLEAFQFIYELTYLLIYSSGSSPSLIQ